MKSNIKIKNIFIALDAKSSPASRWQFSHFIDELSRHDIHFTIFNRSEHPQKNCDEILLRQFHSCKKDVSLFMTGYLDDQISVETIKSIKKTGIPTLLICYDNLLIPQNHKKISPHFDLVWLTSSETKYLFNKWGAKSVFLPYAANPYKFFPKSSNEIPCVGFIGSIYGSRKYKIKILDNNHIPMQVYSGQSNKSEFQQKEPVKLLTEKLNLLEQLMINNFRLLSFYEGRILIKGNLLKAFRKRFEKGHLFTPETEFLESPSFEEMNRLYSEFAITLGIIDAWNTYLLEKPLFKIHLRTFEIPMCGGLQITNRTAEIQSYFNEGEEIILYNSNEEMIEKMKFYLREEYAGTRKKMKIAARKRAEHEHAWINRFSKISDQLFR